MINWTKIVEIAITCIASVGGIGAIIVWVSKSLSDVIADRLSKKYQLQLDKEKEKFKNELSRKDYVSKARFDTEFKIYRELSSAFCMMVKDISIMIPSGFNWKPADDADRKEYEEECYSKALKSTNKAQDTLYASAVFIPEKYFQGYDEVLKLCRMQLNVFCERYNVLAPPSQRGSLRAEDYKRTSDISNKWDELNNLIRDYLASLDVI